MNPDHLRRHRKEGSKSTSGVTAFWTPSKRS